MTLQGKGFFTFNLPECEGGDPAAIVAAALAAGLSHVIIKIADTSVITERMMNVMSSNMFAYRCELPKR